MGEGGKGDEVSSFWFLVNVKNGKDPTDRHWNMKFFFRETDRQEWKTRLGGPAPLTPCWNQPPAPALGTGEVPEQRRGDRVQGGKEGL